MQNYYKLDDADRLIECGGEWDEFAAKNGGQAAVRSRVHGHRLWDFVVDFDTTSYLNGIFFWCRRRHEPFETTYRCDGPTTKRLFRMTVSPIGSGELHVEHALVSSTDQGSERVVSLLERRTHARCSICAAVNIGGEWIEPFSRPDERFFPDSYTVCASCKATTVAALRRDAALHALPELRRQRG